MTEKWQEPYCVWQLRKMFTGCDLIIIRAKIGSFLIPANEKMSCQHWNVRSPQIQSGTSCWATETQFLRNLLLLQREKKKQLHSRLPNFVGYQSVRSLIIFKHLLFLKSIKSIKIPNSLTRWWCLIFLMPHSAWETNSFLLKKLTKE